MKANKFLAPKISLNGACMAVHNGFDNRFYADVRERKQDTLCKLNFEVWSYCNLFSPVHIILVYRQRYLFKLYTTGLAIKEPSCDADLTVLFCDF